MPGYVIMADFFTSLGKELGMMPYKVSERPENFHD